MHAQARAVPPSPCRLRRLGHLLAVALLAVTPCITSASPADPASDGPAAAAPQPTTPRPATAWRAVGPAGAGTVEALEVDPRQPERVYLATAEGVFASRDGGESWQMSALPGVTALALHPARPHRLFAVTQTAGDRFRLWRSDDRARTWKPLTEVEAPAGSGREVTVHALALHPGEPDRLFVGGRVRTADGSSGRLWRSDDGGDTLTAAPAPAGLAPAALLAGPGDTLLAGTRQGVFRSDDRGDTWRTAREGLEAAPGRGFLEVRHLAAWWREPRVLLAGTGTGAEAVLFRSDDDGESWTPVDGELPVAAVGDLLVDPRDRRSLWVLSDGHGVHATRGGPWRRLDPDLPGDVAPRHLALAPGSPPSLYVAAGGELYRRVALSPECTDDADTLCLGGRFRVDVEWWRPEAGTRGTGRAVPVSGEGGWFWFRAPERVEMAVKLLREEDATGGPAWVYVASLSGAGLDLRVFDVETGRFETFRQAPGDHGAATGVATFPAAGRPAGAPLWFAALPDGGCGGEAIDLCLWDGRFQVRVDWHTRDGEEGAAVADRLSGQAGWFRFRRPDDPELFVQIADGRDDNGHWQVSFASLSDAGFEVTVRDRESGESVSYDVPAGEPHSHRDDRAFRDER